MDSSLSPLSPAFRFTVYNFAPLRDSHFSEAEWFWLSCCKMPLPGSPRIESVCPLVYSLGFRLI